MGSFKRWFLREGKDIFGFERLRLEADPPETVEDKPIKPINSDLVMEFMMRSKIGGVEPVLEFSNQIKWGDDPGSMMMVISPLGSYKSIVRRLQLDLEGREVWTCQRIFLYKDLANASEQFDDKLANYIFEHIEKIHGDEIKAPSHDYDGLKRLILKTARTCSRKDVLPDLLLYRGIKEVEENRRYIIFFECRGQGVETPGSSRLEQFAITMSYNPSTGMIRSFGNDIQSPTKGHKWYPQPSEWDEYFSSGKKDSDIVDCVAAAFSSY